MSKYSCFSSGIIAPNKLQDERITYNEYKALAEAKFDRLEVDFELHFRSIGDVLMEAELRTSCFVHIWRISGKILFITNYICGNLLF